MNNKTLNFKIILPSEIIVEKESEMVNLCAANGILGVLPDHADLVVSLDIGVVSAFSSNQETKYFIYSGIASINNNKVEIVTEFAADLQNINKQSIIDMLEKIKEEIKANSDNEEFVALHNSKLAHYQALADIL